jgi:hypothetical protein
MKGESLLQRIFEGNRNQSTIKIIDFMDMLQAKMNLCTWRVYQKSDLLSKYRGK